MNGIPKANKLYFEQSQRHTKGITHSPKASPHVHQKRCYNIIPVSKNFGDSLQFDDKFELLRLTARSVLNGDALSNPKGGKNFEKAVGK